MVVKVEMELFGALAAALGFLPEPTPVTLQELIPYFDPAKLPRDAVKLPEGF